MVLRRRKTGKAALFSLIILALLFSAGISWADGPKRELANNMTETYNVLPGTADKISEVLTKGMFYGRLRTNYIYRDIENESSYDPTGFGLGGSVIYKTAAFNGVSATAGLYTSQNLGLLKDNDALFGKAGKDTFSRYDRMAEGDWGMTVLGQAYLQYNFYRTEIKAGRQAYEGFLAKSNDTKMIPNTFRGYTLVTKDIPDTTLSLAFFDGQKLRDHTGFHDVITYNDGSGTTYGKWNNQDDSATHKGLSYANLRAAGKDTDNSLIIVGFSNKSIENMTLDLWYNSVPDLFYSLMVESNYQITLSNGWSLTPGLRYMAQFDAGAGRVGGAALNGSLAGLSGASNGYRVAESVDAGLYAVRLVLKKGAVKLLTAYSKVADEADIIAPWRGFPTGGYTRSMGEYNWYAGSGSLMVQAYYDFGKANVIEGLRASIDYVYTDMDDKKILLGGNSDTDRSIIHSDVWYRFPAFPELEAKLRLKISEGDRSPVSGIAPSYQEFRFELNYLF